MSKPNVLVIVDKDDVGYLDTGRQSQHWNIVWKVVDYSRLHKQLAEIRQLVTTHGIDFVLYSRNDQIASRVSIGPVTREARTGYSSFSGIDTEDRVEQMVACFDDFMECDRELCFAPGKRPATPAVSDAGRTFSLLFDSEQLGGIRYGLPRILDLLSKYGVRATFFVTNLVEKVYPGLLGKLEGHEVGLHGRWHEYLSGLSEDEQEAAIRAMAADLGTGVNGANFIGRMDENTVPALVKSGLPYFVYPLINYYWLFSYPKLPTAPSLVCTAQGDIWALPVSVETYGSPWFAIRNMVDSAIAQGEMCGFPHISILCHPFRDGNLQHVGTTEKLLQHLVGRGLVPVTLGELAERLSGAGSAWPEVSDVAGLAGPQRVGLSPPRTRQDFVGMVPHNLMLARALFLRGRTFF